MPRPEPSRMVTLHAKSFEYLAVETPLRFPPPMIALADRDDSYTQQWHFIQYAFDVGDPATFPPLAVSLAGDDLRVVRRYVEKARELAGSVMLTADDGIRITWNAESNETQVQQMTRTRSDIETGFLTIFRQFDWHKDDASYPRVNRILHEHASAATDEAAADRMAELKRWADAIKQSHRRSLRRSVLLRAIELGQWPPEPPEQLGTFPDSDTPEALIDRYLYSDRIHWDSEKAREVESRPDDRLRDGGIERLDFLDATTGLAHLYIGFAELVRRAARLTA